VHFTTVHGLQSQNLALGGFDLSSNNLPTDRTRELLKPSKDAESSFRFKKLGSFGSEFLWLMSQ